MSSNTMTRIAGAAALGAALLIGTGLSSACSVPDSQDASAGTDR
jgi:hypothetical protein